MNFEFGDPIFYTWSTTRDRSGIIKQPYPEDSWVPGRDIAFTSGGMWSETAVREGGRLTSETIEHLLALNCVVKTDANVSRDVVEDFAVMLDRMPLLSGQLKSSLDNEFPNVFEFIELPEVWNETTQGPLPGGPYYLTNLLARQDSWDKEKTKFYDFKRGDGSKYTEAAQTQRFISGELVAEFPIWRDKVTSNVICTERFREVAEGAGCREWRFTELPFAKRELH
ncbi:conserved hypothetical protein [Roseovarius sp. EC-HK134]|nr:conserved hypothetical protein [Roseovarius sp. EC-HK134]